MEERNFFLLFFFFWGEGVNFTPKPQECVSGDEVVKKIPIGMAKF